MTVSFRRRWGDEWSSDAAAGFQQDVEEVLSERLQVPKQTATANTVAWRDSNGDIFAHRFNQSAAVENPTIGNVIVENNSSDGNFRRITIANFASQLPAASLPAAQSVAPTTTTNSQTPTAGSGAFTSVSATVTLERVSGEHFYRVQVQITITTNGTAAGFINVPLGITASKESMLAGRCAAISGKMVQGIVAATTATLVVTLYDNTYPGSSGERITLSGVVYV